MNFFIVYNNVVVVAAAAIIFIALFGLSNGEKPEHSISTECATKRMDCDQTRERPVCGTDDKTYPSRCHLLRIQCTGHLVSVKHRGPCKECQQSRQYALKNKYRSRNQFIPKCRSDGTYAAVQCVEEHGCWCSDSGGKPIANTTTKNGKPNCKKFLRGIRRSSPRHMNPMTVQRDCLRTDQTQFIANVMQRFNDDYKGYNEVHHTSKSQDINKESILNWKFSKYDTNKNNILDKFEFRKLKQFIKKSAKPKQCARAFGKLCDTNNDEKLSLMEWKICFSPETGNRYHQITTVHNNGGSESKVVSNHHTIGHPNNFPFQGEYEESEEYETDEDYDESDLNGANIPNSNGIFSTLRDTTMLRETETESSDCIADRKTAYEEQHRANSTFYVPECTLDGRYEKIQCYPKTGYCWCVDEDTGKVITGSSLKDEIPECKHVARPFKGCPEPHKTKFLRDLKVFFTTNIPLENNASNGTIFKSEDEKIGILSFVHIDKNKNRNWERKEWKEFRDLVMKSKLLRKCGKKLPKYCDVNNDKKITLAEWLNCLKSDEEISKNDVLKGSNSTLAPKSTKLTGPNPLESILK
ncbi:SMOC1 family protein [Megaselia abdita]